jgi:hypothetical protein
MNTIHTPDYSEFLEKSRNAILNAGYHYVVWKSRVKKNAISLKKRVLLFYF